MKLKIKKGDKVEVISGANAGKHGKILVINKKKMTVTVEGVNMRKHHQKAKANQPSGIVTKEGPMHYSKVMLLDASGKTTRVGYKWVDKDGGKEKVKFAKTTGDVI